MVFLAPVFGRGVSMHARRACSSFWQPSAVYPDEAQQPSAVMVSSFPIGVADRAQGELLGEACGEKWMEKVMAEGREIEAENA